MDLTTTSPRFERIYRNLVVSDIKRQLTPFFSADVIAEEDLAYALSVASRLALGADGVGLDAAGAARKAYDVATRTLWLGNGSGPWFREASELILSRLGNFPARQLMNERFSMERDALLELEVLGREFENRAAQGGRSMVLTDFQVRLLKALEMRKCVSVSAPTSAGKSFTLELEISRRLESAEDYCVVYLVPTRALIRQVTFDLVQLIRGTAFQDVPILSVPSISEEAEAIRKKVYVLTQERFANLLAIEDEKLKLHALIVDEAQEISEEDRGQTLEAVIGEALARFPAMQVFFSSPLKSNPEYLLTTFGSERDGESFVEYVTPVSQNIINIHPLKGRGNTAKARFEVWLEGESVTVGTIDLPFRFRNPYLHKFAMRLTSSEDSSIIYCSEPGQADKIAALLATELTGEETDDAISDLVDFLRGHIHPLYRLADALEKGVAFHYGNIPQVIRSRIEELLLARALRFVCCTSTLLQGMNLPAKNIFVENPKKGRGRPMSPGDFWNLVGRAGRMAREFDGNIYCVHGVQWESEPLKSPRLDPIESAFSVALTDRVAVVAEVAAKLPESSESDRSWAEQTIARIYGQYTSRGRSIADSQFANPANRSMLQALDEAMQSVRTRQTLPALIFERNLYFHPARLEELADRFRRGDAGDWIPPNPNARGSYYGLRQCFQILEEVFFRTGFETYVYDAFLASMWMQGAGLKELILNKIEHNKAEGDVDRINDLIREVFSDVENKLRYKYVKYMKVYGDVLRAVLVEKGRIADVNRIPPIHLYLEYGASSTTLISLIAIGLSRTSAILLKHARQMGDELSVKDCQRVIETLDVAGVLLPAICKHEIARLRRRT